MVAHSYPVERGRGSADNIPPQPVDYCRLLCCLRPQPNQQNARRLEQFVYAPGSHGPSPPSSASIVASSPSDDDESVVLCGMQCERYHKPCWNNFMNKKKATTRLRCSKHEPRTVITTVFTHTKRVDHKTFLLVPVPVLLQTMDFHL